jgi:phosphopantothenoylcysteine synthetase/decarboxylase
VAYDTLYLIVSGAGTARRIPALLPELARLARNVITVLTPNAERVVSPRELALVPGHQIVESYFDGLILPRPPPGVVLVAPCSFNTLNKLSSGIADNLALSITSEAIGRHTPVVIAVSVNAPLWAHPLSADSVATLRRWSCDVLDPVPYYDGVTLAGDERILEAARRALARD